MWLCWAAGALEDAISCGVTVPATSSMRRMSAASDEVALRMDTIQVELDEGPSLSCLREGVVVRVGDLVTDRRWAPLLCAGPRTTSGGSALGTDASRR